MVDKKTKENWETFESWIPSDSYMYGGMTESVTVQGELFDPDQEIISLLCKTDGEIDRFNPVTASFSGTSRVSAVEVALGNAETEILVGVPIDVKFGSDSN